MSERTHIDEAIREKFDNFSAEPPAHLWEEIGGELNRRKKRRRMVYVSWISAAAVVVFAFLAGWIINEQRSQISPSLVEQPITQEQKTGSTDLQKQFNASTESTLEDAIASVDQSDKRLLEGDEFLAQNAKSANIISTDSEQHRIRKPEAVAYLKIKKAELTTYEKSGLAQVKTEKKVNPDAILPVADQTIVAANLKSQSDVEEAHNKWIVGAHVSPGYAAHTSSYSASYSQNMSDQLTGGVENMGGGVSVQYKTGKKLRLETGVYYAQNTQGSGTSGRLFSNTPNYDYATGNLATPSGEAIYANIVELQKGGLALNSTAGVVKISETPKGSELSANKIDGAAFNTATLLTNGEFSQVFDFVEIPLYLRYRVLDKKFGIDFMGGVNAGIIVGNNVFITTPDGQQRVGSTEDISALNLSGTLGMGVSYALGTHFSLALEPRVNYYLNSINTNPDISYKPYRFGLFTGIYYAF